MVLQSNFPPDIRIEKEAKALVEAGYNVFILARYDKGQKKEETIKGVRVRRVNITAKYFPKKLQSLRFYFGFKDSFWEREIKKLVNDFGIEVLHIHDLPLVRTGIEVAKKNNLLIVADLHENYPAAMQVWKVNNKKTKIKDFLLSPLKGLKRWENYERKCVEEVDKVIVVIEEARERLLKYGISEKKITVISNVVDVDNFTNINTDENITQKYKNSFVISYIGGFGPHRGINCAIKAMKYLKGSIGGVRMVLVGHKNKNYMEVLKQLALRHGVYDLIDFVGWQPFEKIPSYIRTSDVCLVPHNKNPHTDTTMPHKLFQYMLEGKPVVVSSCKPLKRVVEETNSGLVFEAGNEKELAHKIIDLYKNESLRRELEKNGKRAVQGQYNWRMESKKLINLYRKLEDYYGRKEIKGN